MPHWRVYIMPSLRTIGDVPDAASACPHTRWWRCSARRPRIHRGDGGGHGRGDRRGTRGVRGGPANASGGRRCLPGAAPESNRGAPVWESAKAPPLGRNWTPFTWRGGVANESGVQANRYGATQPRLTWPGHNESGVQTDRYGATQPKLTWPGAARPLQQPRRRQRPRAAS